MRAVEVPEAGADPRVVERDVPDPGPGEVRVEVAACGVCGGDEAVIEGSDAIDYPRVPGHEIAGRVDAVGERVTEWAPGDRVATGWYGGHCFTCDACRRGAFTHCEAAHITGISGDGGYAEFTLVAREALAAVPEDVDLVDAGPLVCAGLTAYNALRHSGADPGDRVAVQGIGGVGHMGVQYADAAGYETVALSRGPGKADVARDLGADRFVDAAAEDPAAALRDLGGADVVFSTAPSAAAIESVVGGLAPGGELVVVGAPDEPVELELGRFLGNRWSVQGWSSGHARDAEDAMAVGAAEGVAPLVEAYPLERAADAYAAMQAGDVRFRAVLEP